MKKIIYTLIFTILLIIPFNVNASEKKLNIYLFYGDGCPHCALEEEFLDDYLKDKDYITLNKYEVWKNNENQTKLADVKKILDNNDNGIPYLIIGNNALVGFTSNYSEDRIINTINYYLETDYEDKVGQYLGVVKNTETNKGDSKYETNEIDIPIIGKKDATNVSILLVTALIGFVDGVNPCAMWILLFLISMLLGMKDKKRMWTLGITFLLASALVYFLFLISWLNLALFLNKIIYIRIAICAISIVFGTVSIFKFFSSKEDGCEVVDSKNRKRIITSIKKIVKEQSFLLALLGVIALAASVNVIELLCSLGLPVTFTQILAINGVSNAGKIFYSLLYILFFLLDDIIIFVIAMKTLEVKAISNKFGKWAHLIGGLIMIIIGILLLYRPEWLMLNF